MHNLSTVLYALIVLEDDDIIPSSSACTFNSNSVKIHTVNSIQGVSTGVHSLQALLGL